MVDNVQAELERIEEEEKAQPEPLDDFNAHKNEDADSFRYQTQTTTLSMVDNVQAELERIEEEEKAQPEPLDDFNAHKNEDAEEEPEDDERQS